ncbi:serine hydrolase [Chitinophaga flava]|uniref:Serine hydrolase n=1 Tax=Chitinophaga flava TaxID=2259036 RepID=A0A365XY26_9BACT|nr:serine hydrolase [Chitinophaga flava]RBL91252.1 hypothetical protein DF182_01100 [Chitinophaga flava]
MKISSTAFLCLIMAFYLPVPATGQDNIKLFDSLLTSSFPANEPGGVVLIARNNQVLYRKALGKANLELNIDMQPDQVFRLGSVTKQFTACAILTLAQQGKLSLQDPVTRFIPDYPRGADIHIAQLLTHTAGIKNYTGLSKFTREQQRQDLSARELVDFFRNEPLDFEPGTAFSYSNSGYVLLGYIIEQITGKSYATYINENFFQPLSMTHSFYDDAVTIIPQRVPGYKYTGNHYENAGFLSMTLPYAAGSLLSNADDLLKWYQALMSGKVVSHAALEKAYASSRLSNGRLTGYGYGWAIGNVQGSRSIKHIGIVNGFVAYVVYLPDEKLFAAILTNRENAPDPDILASRMLATLLSKPYDYTEITLTESERSAYQHTYVLEDGSRKTVACQDGNLMYYNPGALKARLIPLGRDLFRINASLTNLRFERNQKGQVTSFTQEGTELPIKGIANSDRVSTLKRIIVSPQQLSAYTGKYQFNPGPVFEVKLEDGRLYGQVGNDKKELIPFETHKFFARDLDAVIIFNLNAQHHVTGLTKLQQGEMKALIVDSHGH